MGDPLADPRACDLLAAEPDEAAALAAVFRSAASESSHTAVGLAAAQDDGVWTGRAADAFRRAIGVLPRRLGRVGTGFAAVAAALGQYESNLALIQPVFVSVIAELKDAQARLPGLKATQTQADGGLLAASSMPGAGRAARAEVAAARADGAVASCIVEIGHLRRRAFELLDEFAAARQSCREAIVEAQRGAPVPPPVGSGVVVVALRETFS
jgi:hypothetical protein